MNARARSASILGLAAVSGAAALVYEVAFFRGLGLALGVASHAVASVVGAFLFGLGLGAWLGGRWLANVRPLRAYAAVEATIALYGLAAPWLMQRARELAESGALGASTGVRPFVAAFVLLAVPTVCMGATFPLLGRAVAGGRASPWASVGWLYALNTLGACGGALLAAYTLLPAFGLTGSTHVAVALNVALALAAAWLARGESTGENAEERTPQVSVAPAPAGLLALSVALIGAASLMLQVLANRLILSLLGGTVYVFAAIVAVFLFGIALGGAVGGHVGARTKRPATLLGVLALAFALSVGAGIALLRWRAGGEDLLAGPDNLSLLAPGEWLDVYPASRYLALTVKLAGLALLPATLVSGAFLPIAIAWARATRAQLGRSLGRVYFWNTLGSIVGSFVASFWLLPELGLRGGIVAVAAVAIVAGLSLLASSSARAEGTSTGLRAAALVAALVSMTAFLPRDPPGTREGLATVFESDSAASSAKVQEFADASEPAPVRNLRVNGKTVASSVFIDRRLQYLLGFVSTLSHPEPRKLLCIGLGTGMTSAAMAVAGGELTVVEISPSVIEAARRFSIWNEALHERDDVTLVADDGRAWLARSGERFDVISADPIDPCVSGSAYLYTEEYYRLGRARLAEGGLMSQWIPLYDLAPSDISGIVRTFRRVFPDATAWVTGYDMVLVGGAGPLEVELPRVAERMEEPRLRAMLADVGIETPEELLACCFAGRTTLEVFEGLSDRPNTDDDPWIEFHAPFYSHGTYPLDVYRWLATAEDAPPLAGADRFQLAAVLSERRRLQQAALAFVTSIEQRLGYGVSRTTYTEALRAK